MMAAGAMNVPSAKSHSSWASGVGKTNPASSYPKTSPSVSLGQYHRSAEAALVSKSHTKAQTARVAPMNMAVGDRAALSLPHTLDAPHPAAAKRSSPTIRKGATAPAGPHGLTTLQTLSETTATAAPCLKPKTNATRKTIVSISLMLAKPASAKSEATMTAENTATTATSLLPTVGWIIHPMEMYFGGAEPWHGNVNPSKSGGSVRVILRIAESRAPGPSPSFSGPHVLLMFLTIASSSYVGRKALAERTGLGEGAARTVLGKLKKKGLVGVIRSGCFLTPSGEKLAAAVGSTMSSIVSVPHSALTMGPFQSAIALRDAAGRVRSGIEQRDSAIRMGASGATTYVVKGGKFTMPGGSSDCEKDFPGPAWSVLKELAPKNNDVVILCGGHTEVSSNLGLLAAASTLM